jgi:hypothetical protein
MFSKGKRSSSHLNIHQPRSARALFIRAGLITLALGSFVAAGALAVVMSCKLRINKPTLLKPASAVATPCPPCSSAWKSVKKGCCNF